ncbi:MAG: DNA recombination protein RmuC, partial [bacterium JZ-2024 1]
STLKEKEEAVEQVAGQLHDQFVSASQAALQQNRDAFLALAGQTLKVILEQAKGDVQQTTASLQQVVTPIQEALKQYQQYLQELEARVKQDYGALSTTSEDIKKELLGLRQTAQGLTLALSGNISARGTWGQLQLERVAELAGLKKGLDYEIQVKAEDGRPDMVVYLPNQRRIVVDAKAPAIDLPTSSEPHQTRAAVEKFGTALKSRIKELSAREYWNKIGESLDLVVLFLGAEGPLALAVETNRDIIDEALKQNVLIATPATLYAIFKAVAATWKSHRATQDVAKIVTAGRELYTRFSTFTEHLSNVGAHLKRAVDSYNQAIGSFERRLVPGARKLYELGAGEASHPPESLEITPIEEEPRAP